MIDVGPVKAAAIPFGTDYERRAGVGIEIGHNGEPFTPRLILDVVASAGARKVEIVPTPQTPDGYFRFSILLPDGTTLSVSGSERWGYAAALFDEDGKYLTGASKSEAEQRRHDREAAR